LNKMPASNYRTSAKVKLMRFRKRRYTTKS
jgi:hypothetical protein